MDFSYFENPPREKFNTSKSGLSWKRWRTGFIGSQSIRTSSFYNSWGSSHTHSDSPCMARLKIAIAFSKFSPLYLHTSNFLSLSSSFPPPFPQGLSSGGKGRRVLGGQQSKGLRKQKQKVREKLAPDAWKHFAAADHKETSGGEGVMLRVGNWEAEKNSIFGLFQVSKTPFFIPSSTHTLPPEVFLVEKGKGACEKKSQLCQTNCLISLFQSNLIPFIYPQTPQGVFSGNPKTAPT